MDLEQRLTAVNGWLLKKPKVAGIVVFLFFVLLIGFISYQRYRILKENAHKEMNSVLNVIEQNIEQSLKNSYTAALTLALTINYDGVPENFNEVGAQLIDSNSNFQAVQLVPDGIIKYVYPVAGNEKAINYNIFNGFKDNVVRAREAIKSRKMYFLGPDKLQQGGIGLVGRLPVYRKNKFWGFSAVVIKLDTFLKSAGIYNAKDNNYFFQFSKFNVLTQKEEFFLPGNTDFSGYMYETATFPDGNWRLYLVAANRYDTWYQIISPALFGLLLAVLCSLLLVQLLRKTLKLQMRVHDQASELLITENKFKTIFNEAAIGIALVRSDNGHFLQVNKRLVDRLGYSEEELYELSFQSITYPESIYAELDGLKDLRSGLINELKIQTRYIHKDGSIKWANVVETPLITGVGKAESHILIVEDITERKASQKDLSDSFNLLNEQNKRLMNFSYIVSHNLRSHSSNIQAITNLIDISESETERLEMIKLLKVVSDSLNETMINLNQVVNIQTNVNIVSEPLNLRKYINIAVSILNDQVVLTDADIRNHVPDHVIVNYNPAYLESVLLNFIYNAIRYAHPDRFPIIELSTFIENDQIVLQISDNGIGIDLDRYGNELFGMYKTFTSNPDSKGVGLFISKNQIDAMGGSVTVKSTLNIGTMFNIYFK
ncbi:sensor histidine kinase [Pedobacter metabolipauper]|uniref:histidine kinase n=1 Tax=Pedobacter metabolipauper TaxID=425513 RepID=A0A4R6T0N0_9SPHI|nr:PAS domain S-box protein [Pedobacter metabolipauper]TDQ11138.1 PAS domain S-box-containing protein [Pedobacter metabolipauper]